MIDDINRMMQQVIADKKYWPKLVVALGEFQNPIYQVLSHRLKELGHMSPDWNGAWLKEQYSTGRYTSYYSVYGHDLEGKVKNLGKLNPTEVKRDPTSGGDVWLCLDTMVGRPKNSALKTALAGWADSRNNRPADEEEIKGWYEGDLLICSIKPEIKDPEQKLVQTQQAVLNGLMAYENWYKSLPAGERTAAYDQERQIAHMMLTDTMAAETPSGVRLVLQDFAKEIYAAKLASHSQLRDHRNNLLSYLLDSINAAYPPLSLAVKLGSAEAGTHSFTIDYPDIQGEPSENARLASVKSVAFQKMKQIGIKAQSDRSGVDVATIKANNAQPKSPSGPRRFVQNLFNPRKPS
jgi:hypothetical protein